MGYVLSWRRQSKAIDLSDKPTNFEGRYFNKNPAYNWKQYIPISSDAIRYLEIGVADGGNLIQFAKSYGAHPDSKLYCVDPWQDYDEYPEYKGYQDIAWNTVNKNIRTAGIESKCIIHRGFSDTIVPTFEDNFFDIIFVDGNHETDYVYRDGKMAYDKCKAGGYIVFDDYSSNPTIWPQTKKGIDMFLDEYKDKIRILTQYNAFLQVIIQKI
jgi:predicted O-methyltransferase YrrM